MLESCLNSPQVRRKATQHLGWMPVFCKTSSFAAMALCPRPSQTGITFPIQDYFPKCKQTRLRRELAPYPKNTTAASGVECTAGLTRTMPATSRTCASTWDAPSSNCLCPCPPEGTTGRQMLDVLACLRHELDVRVSRVRPGEQRAPWEPRAVQRWGR